LVLSFLLPGLGTMINGQAGKGVGIMVGYFLGALLSVILIGLPIMFGFWVWGMVDAYSGAKEHNARHGFHRSEEHTSELQSRFDLVCRLLLEKTRTKRKKALIE